MVKMLTAHDNVAEEESGNESSRSGKTTNTIDSAIAICRFVNPTAARVFHARRICTRSARSTDMIGQTLGGVGLRRAHESDRYWQVREPSQARSPFAAVAGPGRRESRRRQGRSTKRATATCASSRAKRGARAEMRARCEREIRRRIAEEIEFVRARVDGGISICAGDHHADLLARRDANSAEYDVVEREPRDRDLHRWFEAQYLLAERRHE